MKTKQVQALLKAEREGTLTTEQAGKLEAHRASDRERQSAKRQRDRDRVAVAGDETPETFWKRNREVANQTQIAALLERQERVFDLLHWMEAQVNGTYDVDPNDETAYVGLEEGTADVAADVTEHGAVPVETILLEFWKRPDTFAMLTQRGDGTNIFVRYGIVTGLPGHRLHEWEQWVASRKPMHPSTGNGYTTLRCVNSATCGALPIAVSQAIADEYRENNIPYRCHVCIARERSGNAAIGKALAVEYKQPESTIFDSWGRVKL